MCRRPSRKKKAAISFFFSAGSKRTGEVVQRISGCHFGRGHNLIAGNPLRQRAAYACVPHINIRCKGGVSPVGAMQRILANQSALSRKAATSFIAFVICWMFFAARMRCRICLSVAMSYLICQMSLRILECPSSTALQFLSKEPWLIERTQQRRCTSRECASTLQFQMP